MSELIQETIQRIIRNHQYEEIDGFMIDVQTANAIETVASNLRPENKEKFLAMPISKMSMVAWKLIGKR